ncbi:MAG: hypothetical protein DDT20_01805 [Firmicutes bacterium]|nr:hypothetical protein [Bacillota bacterium]
MKTICELAGKIVMMQDGDQLATMIENAKQYPGAVARVVTDAQYAALTAPTQAEINERANAIIRAALAAADLAIIRALAEGDTVRIAAYNIAQAALRAQLK